MLELTQLQKKFQGPERVISALVDVSLTVADGQFAAVRGRSGSGKTTLLLVAGGLLAPDSGKVTVDQEDLYAQSRDERARLRGTKIGFVFQQFHLIPYLSVLDNILVPQLALDVPEAAGRGAELAERFGLTARLRHVPAELSVGERQRTAMARALLNQPRVLLADEPTGNLDRENAEVVLGHLRAFSDDGGSVLLVTHDPIAADYAHEMYNLEEGRLSREG